MLKDQLLQDLKDAMRDKDDLKKDTVQMIRAAILQIEKDTGEKLEDDKIMDVIAKEAKKRKDAAADFEKSGRQDLIDRNNTELEIISSYLPKALSKEENRDYINMGMAMINLKKWREDHMDDKIIAALDKYFYRYNE